MSRRPLSKATSIVCRRLLGVRPLESIQITDDLIDVQVVFLRPSSHHPTTHRTTHFPFFTPPLPSFCWSALIIVSENLENIPRIFAQKMLAACLFWGEGSLCGCRESGNLRRPSREHPQNPASTARDSQESEESRDSLRARKGRRRCGMSSIGTRIAGIFGLGAVSGLGSVLRRHWSSPGPAPPPMTSPNSVALDARRATGRNRIGGNRDENDNRV